MALSTYDTIISMSIYSTYSCDEASPVWWVPTGTGFQESIDFSQITPALVDVTDIPVAQAVIVTALPQQKVFSVKQQRMASVEASS